MVNISIDNDYHDISFLLGIINIQVDKLWEPPKELSIRDVKEWYVDLLAKFLKKEENDKEDLTLPILVVASVEKKEFKEKNANKYTYQVIGGMQRFNAIMKANETEGERISTRRCFVYSSGLSQGSILAPAPDNTMSIIKYSRSLHFPNLRPPVGDLCFVILPLDKKMMVILHQKFLATTLRSTEIGKQQCLDTLVSTQVVSIKSV